MPIPGLKKLAIGLSSIDLEEEQYRIVEDNRDDIVLAQAEVLSEGKDKTGNKRADEYRPFTIQYKQEFGRGLGRVVDRVTFFMTGNLYYSLFARVSKRTFSVESPLPTFDKMIERIGKDNYGLDPQRKAAFRDRITIPRLKSIFFERTGLHL
jgi:hypothetical protein